MNLQRIGALILGFALLSHTSEAQELKVAAAANLQFAMQDTAARFQKQSGKHVKLIYNSLGNFFQKIQNGAPFDKFFAASLEYPKKLEAVGLVQAGGYYQYARGKIVVWVHKASKVDVNAGLRAVLNAGVSRRISSRT